MTRRDTARQIDWRREFLRLEPYLDGRGGIVNLRYRGESSGFRAFLGVMRQAFATRGDGRTLSKPSGVSIQLDPENYRVLYLDGIRSEFERVLGRRLATPVSANLEMPGGLASHNSAGGNQHIEATFNVTVNLEPDDGPAAVSRRHEWASSLATALREHLSSARFMIVLTCGLTKEQREFRTSLWNTIADLTSDGLLLVRLLDEEAPDFGRLQYEYPYNCEVSLPTELDREAIVHAVEDIVPMIHERRPTESLPECQARADTFVRLCKKDVGFLHDRLLAFLGDLEES